MVQADMVQAAAIANNVFHALSNETRRQILERLAAGPATVMDLAEPFDMKLPSFVQHLSVLEKSELVASTKQGRVRTYAIAPAHFQVAEDWLSQQRKLWEARFDRFDDYVLELKNKQLKKKEETK